jgi:hypothetical protein
VASITLFATRRLHSRSHRQTRRSDFSHFRSNPFTFVRVGQGQGQGQCIYMGTHQLFPAFVLTTTIWPSPMILVPVGHTVHWFVLPDTYLPACLSTCLHPTLPPYATLARCLRVFTGCHASSWQIAPRFPGGRTTVCLQCCAPECHWCEHG